MKAQPATVLVVDDEVAVRRLVVRALAGVGFVVKEAEHGVSALQQIGAPEPLHLVISDIHMPVMDGLVLARELRSLRPQLPILFMTGRESPGLTGEILRKPFGPEALLVAVMKMLGRPAAAPESSPM